jgi:DNA-binding HxlR family transcriptional regulator
MISRDDLRRLSAGRWHIPLLAFISREGGARFGLLLRQLGVSRSVLSRHIDSLEKAGWLCRNPGHGHPLRPEYLVTDRGRPVAAWCERVVEQRRRLGLEPEGLGRWSLPLLLGLDRSWKRFSTLQAELMPVTPRALSLTLKKLLDVRLVERRLEDRFPPRPLYGLSGRGEGFARALL